MITHTEKFTKEIQNCISSANLFEKESKGIRAVIMSGDPANISAFLDTIQPVIADNTTPSLSRFYALYLLKATSEGQNPNLVSALASQHTLLNSFREQANFDKDKEFPQRGSTMFSSSPTDLEKKLGTKYLSLLLEMIKYWSLKYGKKDNLSSFQNLYTSLTEEDGVPFPANFHYYKSSSSADQKDRSNNPDQKTKLTPKPSSKPENKEVQGARKDVADLKRIINEIRQFYENCNEETEEIKMILPEFFDYLRNVNESLNNRLNYLFTAGGQYEALIDEILKETDAARTLDSGFSDYLKEKTSYADHRQTVLSLLPAASQEPTAMKLNASKDNIEATEGKKVPILEEQKGLESQRSKLSEVQLDAEVPQEQKQFDVTHFQKISSDKIKSGGNNNFAAKTFGGASNGNLMTDSKMQKQGSSFEEQKRHYDKEPQNESQSEAEIPEEQKDFSITHVQKDIGPLEAFKITKEGNKLPKQRITTEKDDNNVNSRPPAALDHTHTKNGILKVAAEFHGPAAKAISETSRIEAESNYSPEEHKDVQKIKRDESYSEVDVPQEKISIDTNHVKDLGTTPHVRLMPQSKDKIALGNNKQITLLSKPQENYDLDALLNRNNIDINGLKTVESRSDVNIPLEEKGFDLRHMQEMGKMTLASQAHNSERENTSANYRKNRELENIKMTTSLPYGPKATLAPNKIKEIEQVPKVGDPDQNRHSEEILGEESRMSNITEVNVPDYLHQVMNNYTQMKPNTRDALNIGASSQAAKKLSIQDQKSTSKQLSEGNLSENSEHAHKIPEANITHLQNFERLQNDKDKYSDVHTGHSPKLSERRRAPKIVHSSYTNADTQVVNKRDIVVEHAHKPDFNMQKPLPIQNGDEDLVVSASLSQQLTQRKEQIDPYTSALNNAKKATPSFQKFKASDLYDDQEVSKPVTTMPSTRRPEKEIESSFIPKQDPNQEVPKEQQPETKPVKGSPPKKCTIFVAKQKVHAGELLDDYDDSPRGKKSDSLEFFLMSHLQQVEKGQNTRSAEKEEAKQHKMQDTNDKKEVIQDQEEGELVSGSMHRPNINRMLAEPLKTNKFKQVRAGRQSAPTRHISADKTQTENVTLNKSLPKIEAADSSPATSKRFAKELKLLETSLKMSRNRSKDLQQIQRDIQSSFAVTKKQPMRSSSLEETQMNLNRFEEELSKLKAESEAVKSSFSKSPTSPHDPKIQSAVTTLRTKCIALEEQVEYLRKRNETLEQSHLHSQSEEISIKDQMETLVVENQHLKRKLEEIDVRDRERDSTKTLAERVSELFQENDWLTDTITRVKQQNDTITKKMSELIEGESPRTFPFENCEPTSDQNHRHAGDQFEPLNPSNNNRASSIFVHHASKSAATKPQDTFDHSKRHTPKQHDSDNPTFKYRSITNDYNSYSPKTHNVEKARRKEGHVSAYESQMNNVDYTNNLIESLIPSDKTGVYSVSNAEGKLTTNDSGTFRGLAKQEISLSRPLSHEQHNNKFYKEPVALTAHFESFHPSNMDKDFRHPNTSPYSHSPSRTSPLRTDQLNSEQSSRDSYRFPGYSNSPNEPAATINTSVYILEELKQNLRASSFKDNLHNFKKSCLKDRSTIYNSEIVQVGAVSSTYIDPSTGSIRSKFTVYFANKTATAISDFSIAIKEDLSFDMSTEPALNDMESSIVRGKQVKQHFFISLKGTPISCVQVHCTGYWGAQKLIFSFHMPVTLIKFMDAQSVSAGEYCDRWDKNRERVLKTEMLQLDSELIRDPQDLKSHLAHLVDLEASESRYGQGQAVTEFGGIYRVKQYDIEFLLKIKVTSVKQVEFQVAGLSRDCEIAKFLLQTLAFLLCE